ncbi:MAG TPA: SGNH/GDSL hydrolase family protein, partial [bacterium]|nr:SGNH/GDSL hydrolase family protein [bacterium]
MRTLKITCLTVCVLAICRPVFSQAVTLVTLGDSLTAGDGDDGIGGGYPPRLQALLDDLYPGTTVDNVAVSGFTSDDLINVELNPAVAALNAAPAGNIRMALVWIGSNDLFGLYNYVCDYEYGNDYSACEAADLSNYTNNLGTILSALRATGAQVYIALLDDQSRRPVMTDPLMRADAYPDISEADVARMSAQVGRYNGAVQAQAAAAGAVTVDFFDTTIFENDATLADDGNHPNGAGYDYIAGRWFQTITGSAPPPPGSGAIGVFRPSSGLWALRGTTRVYFGTSEDTKLFADFDGDLTRDIGIFRESSGLWAIRGVTRDYFGGSSDIPVPGDYDGDGTTDRAVFRSGSGLWVVRGMTRVYFGGSGDRPVTGDYNGDGADDFGIFRGSAGLWALRGISRIYFGTVSDQAVQG